MEKENLFKWRHYRPELIQLIVSLVPMVQFELP